MKLYKNYIKKTSLVYAIIRWPISMAFVFFYKKFIVTGKENIPRNSSIIITPNHQNAALDAYAIITSLSFCQPVFLARADVFKKPFISWVLQMIKILPVYRARDGADSLDSNNEIFELAIELLEKKKPLGTFPEARHNNKRFLLPLKKGIPRIAFLAEEKHNFSLDVKIVPVGIYYDNYENSNGILQVNYGLPISVADYVTLYKENQPRALVALSNQIDVSIKSLMIDIRNQKYNDQYELLRFIFNRSMREKLGFKNNKQINRFKADKATISMLDSLYKNNTECFEKIINKTNEYSAIINQAKIPDRIVESDNKLGLLVFKSLALLLFLPLFLYSYINNILPVLPAKKIVKKIKERQFHSSVKFVLSLFLFPIFYGIQTFIVYLIWGKSLICLAYFISLFAAINIFVASRIWYLDLFTSWRFLFARKSSLASSLSLRTQIIELMNESYIRNQ